MRLKIIISGVLTVLLAVVYLIGFGYINKVVVCLLLALMLLFSYNCTRLQMKYKPDGSRKAVKRLTVICFILYLHMLLSFTLASTYFYRPSSFAFTDPEGFSLYLQTRVNLIPFYTIKEISDVGGFYTVIVNNLGNILALMPMGVFLPLIFFRQRRILMFVLTVTLCVILIESTQMLFLMGVWDIDDLILNVTGAVIMFLVMRSKITAKIYEKIFPGVPYEVR